MKWLKSFPDGRGGFDSMEWDMGDVGMEYVINILKYVVAGFLLCIFICPLLLYTHSGECKKARITQYYHQLNNTSTSVHPCKFFDLFL